MQIPDIEEWVLIHILWPTTLFMKRLLNIGVHIRHLVDCTKNKQYNIILQYQQSLDKYFGTCVCSGSSWDVPVALL
jgi:hypothetical protein